MGRFDFSSPTAETTLDQLLTRKVAGLAVGRVRYSLVCNDDGGILDDVLVGRLTSADFLLVVNASNREKLTAWLQQRFPAETWRDSTLATAMIAVQGPRAGQLLEPLCDLAPGSLEYYTLVSCNVAGVPAIVSRTGYTGEDGWELIVHASVAEMIWSRLIDAGAWPAGLGARDTLRLEAGMPLYGHELSESIHPYQAGLGFAVNLKDRAFIGRDALAGLKGTAHWQRVGLRMRGKRVPRENFAVLADGQRIGTVTSGTFSPTLSSAIAMAYVMPPFAKLGTQLHVDIRGASEPAEVVPLPFYQRAT